MSVITKASSNTRRASTTEREPSEFDGIWINPGINVGDEDNPKFVRMPRGIAVSDLKPRKIYESMDPDFASETAIMNEVIAEIQAASRKLGEGEAITINMELQLYRRQEETEVAPDEETKASVRKALFG